MKAPILCLALAIAAAAMPTAAAAQQPPIVEVEQGRLSGLVSDGISSFKGVPFAAAPVGPLRWRPPQAPPHWSGVRAAQEYGPACPQPDRPDGGGVGRFANQSEDCLTLNIWAPAGTSQGAGLPVMVWLHGGAHRLGAGSARLYDGSELARQGVVLVTVNYRLGLLGYFAHPALTASAGAGEPLGNYGLMDQLAALQWVQANIARFGGDPSNVTVFGESAGAADTIYLLANPNARGLFAKAIVQSGGGLQRAQSLSTQEEAGVRYAAAIGFGASATLEQLRAAPATRWVEAQGGLRGGLGFGPFVDGRLVTEAPWVTFRDGRENDVPLLIGANSDEGSVLATLGVPDAALELALGERVADLRALFPPTLAEQAFRRQAMGDAVFVAPARWIAQQAADGAPSYLYHFSYVATRRRGSVPGAGHATEIPYVFQTWTGTPLEALISAQDRALSQTISACWVSFARTGAPACAGAPAWPAYDPQSDLGMEFGEQIVVRRPERARAYDMMVEQFMSGGR